MPELPEVETARRDAEAHAVGRTVRRTSVGDPLVVRNSSPQGIGRALSGAAITGAERHGKWVWLTTDARQDLLVHFGMTGSFHAHPGGDGLHDVDHVRLHLDDDVVFAVHMPRKLGGVWLVRDDEERAEVTGRLGVDGLAADADALRDALAGSTAGLKAGLMDQAKVAGVGNLLSDELCWQVRVHPRTRCTDLDDGAWDDLATELGRALDVGLDMGHVPTAEGFLLDVRGDDEPHCPRCGAALTSDTVAGRTSWWCPEDQPAP